MNNYISSIQKKISLLLFSLVLTGISYGSIFTATTSGNFSSTATWAGGIVPPTTILLDQITIQSGVTVNLDNNITINGVLAQLDVEGTLNTANSSSLSIDLGTLTGAGTILLNAIDINAGSTISFTGSLTANTLGIANGFQSSAHIIAGQTLNLISGTLSLVSGGSLDVSNNGTIVISGGLLSVGTGGSVGLTGNYNVIYTSNSSIAGVELTGSGLQNVTVNVNSSSSVTLTSNLTVAGTLSFTGGTLILAGYNLTINGAVAASGTGTVSSTSASNISINTSGGTTGTITFSGIASAVNNLTINVGAGNQANIGGMVTVNGTLQLSTGMLSFNNAALTINGNVSGSGSLSGNSSSNLTVTTSGGLATALNFAVGGQSINDFNISVGSGNFVTLGSALTVNGTLSLAGGSNINLNGYTLTVGATGSITGTGSIVANSSSGLTINSTGGISSLIITGPIGNLTINSGGSGSVTLGSNVIVSGMLTLQSGSLVLNSYGLTITGDIAASGSGTISSTSNSNISIATTSSITGSLNFSAGANSVGNFTVNIGSGGSINIGTNLNVSGTLNFTAGTMNIGVNALVIGASGTISGTGSTSYVITGPGGYVQIGITAGAGTAVNFPIGTSTYFAPANIQLAAGSASGQVQVGVMSNVYAQGTAGVDLSATQPLVDATWNVHSDITSNLNLNLQVIWSAAMEVNGFDHTAAYISHYINSSWDMSATAAATAEAGGMFGLQKNGITSLSPFAVFNQGTATAIAEINTDVMFRVFPNPANDNIIVQNIAASTEPVNMDIYNSTGQLMGNYKLTDATSTVSVKGLASGSYSIKFYNNKMSSTKSFIKM